jgi:hypothetical protein
MLGSEFEAMSDQDRREDVLYWNHHNRPFAPPAGPGTPISRGFLFIPPLENGAYYTPKWVRDSLVQQVFFRFPVARPWKIAANRSRYPLPAA